MGEGGTCRNATGEASNIRIVEDETMEKVKEMDISLLPVYINA